MIFNKIGIITNEKKDPLFEHTKNLIDYLSDKKNITIYTEKNCEDLYKICNIFIILGGDGTILRTAAKAALYNIPVIGINLGRIGFMSEIESDEIYLLDSLFTGDYEIRSRMMINAEIIKQTGEIIQAGTALNDAVVTNGGALAKIIEIDIACDGVKIMKYRADGIIASTPTGSTAYSMSAGGPVIDPDIECFCITPICPHSFVNRSLVFSHDSVIEIINKNINSDVYLTIDGQIHTKLDETDIVRIKKSGFSAKLIAIKRHSFFDVVRKKISENF
ncbi:MAG: NAD(+)/NADH kinase [Oscillospiraceae bacterium]|nr:NAD(+)/NADH kinase [Oscillospiraceae bacterium]